MESFFLKILRKLDRFFGMIHARIYNFIEYMRFFIISFVTYNNDDTPKDD